MRVPIGQITNRHRYIECRTYRHPIQSRNKLDIPSNRSRLSPCEQLRGTASELSFVRKGSLTRRYYVPPSRISCNT